MLFWRKKSSRRIRCLCGHLAAVTPRDLERGIDCRSCGFPLPVKAIRMALEAPTVDARREPVYS